ncbi:hypothetical protein B5P46_02040 [Rhizobium leguminosarum]|uniref:BON domain-containing protein n=1 Tax=Rhizobium leguminosarum TaxID=384 RepID=A0A4Q1UDV9_RHILE|nr:hypothetical protein B5P46_02040 [Rhizobium leguminosarum]
MVIYQRLKGLASSPWLSNKVDAGAFIRQSAKGKPMIMQLHTHGRPSDGQLAGCSTASMRASIEAAVAADPRIKCTNLKVSMLGANVILEGFAASRADEANALELARSIATSCRVISRMLVCPAA